MQIHLTAYARSDILRSVQGAVTETKEALALQRKMQKRREKYESILLSYQKEADEQNVQESNPLKRRSKLREIQRRANEALQPVSEEMEAIKRELSDVQSEIVRRLIVQKTQDDVERIFGILEDHGILQPKEGKPATPGRFGKGLVKSLDFEIEKDVYKTLEKVLKKGKFGKIEIFLTKLS